MLTPSTLWHILLHSRFGVNLLLGVNVGAGGVYGFFPTSDLILSALPHIIPHCFVAGYHIPRQTTFVHTISFLSRLPNHSLDQFLCARPVDLNSTCHLRQTNLKCHLDLTSDNNSKLNYTPSPSILMTTSSSSSLPTSIPNRSAR